MDCSPLIVNILAISHKLWEKQALCNWSMGIVFLNVSEIHLYWLGFRVLFYCLSYCIYIYIKNIEFTWNCSHRVLLSLHVTLLCSWTIHRYSEASENSSNTCSHVSERLPTTDLFSVSKVKSISPGKNNVLCQKGHFFHLFCLFVYSFIHSESAVTFVVLLVCFQLKWRPHHHFWSLCCTFSELWLFAQLK